MPDVTPLTAESEALHSSIHDDPHLCLAGDVPCWVLNNLRAIEAAAALPRPEESRVERCAFPNGVGYQCNEPRGYRHHVHGEYCRPHVPRWNCHPFTPEAR